MSRHTYPAIPISCVPHDHDTIAYCILVSGALIDSNRHPSHSLTPKVDLAPPTWDAMEADRMEVARINKDYYERLSDRDVPGVLKLLRGDGEVTMYNNEDNVVKGRGEIDKHLDGKFRLAWAANKNNHKQTVIAPLPT